MKKYKQCTIVINPKPWTVGGCVKQQCDEGLFYHCRLSDMAR